MYYIVYYSYSRVPFFVALDLDLGLFIFLLLFIMYIKLQNYWV